MENLCLDFEARKVTAIVGASGSGKSTVVGLTERWYDPLEGQIYLDGVDIKELNVRWLRSQIGLVQQVCKTFMVKMISVELLSIGTSLVQRYHLQ